MAAGAARGARDVVDPEFESTSANTITGVEGIGSLGFAAASLATPGLLSRAMDAPRGEVRAIGARDLVIGALLLASPWRRTALALRAGSDVFDAVRYGRRSRATLVVALGSVIVSLVGIVLASRR